MPLRRVRTGIRLLAASFTLAMLGMSLAFLWLDYQAAMQRTEASARDLARITEEYARRSFETSDLMAEEVMSYAAAQGGAAALRGSEAAHHFLGELAGRGPGDYLMLVDSAGQPLALSNRHPPPPGSFADRGWFQAHLAGADRHIGEALHSRVTGEILFTFSRALRRADGTLEAVVQVSMRPSFFQDASLTSDTTRGAVLTLWDLEGRLIARTGLTPAQLGRNYAETSQYRRFREGTEGSFRTAATLDGQDRVIAYRRLPDWPAIVAVSVPVASGLAGFHRELAWSLGTLAAVLLALGLLTSLALRLTREQEAGQQALAEANAALRRVQEALEQRVLERTEALAAANARLAESEARFRGIFNATFQFIGLLAPDGTLLEANETALAFAGLRAEEVIGRPFWDAHWWQTGEAAQGRLRDAVARAAAGEFIRYEAAVRGAGDRVTTIDFSLKPVRDEAGRVVLLVPEGRDISALKDAQAQLHEAQKLDTLGRLTGGVAHDFNNLLMVIIGNLALLRKRLPPEDERARRLLEGAVQGADRGAALTRRLLAFARRQELRPAAVELARLVQGMDELLRRSLGPAIRIETALPDGLPPVLVDANQLELAVLNLAVNARDAMPEGGLLRIEAAAMDLAAPAPPELPPGRYLRLAISDTGTGMSEETLRRATEPFYTTKGPGKGSGLGLSMVQGLAAQSGGQLQITSRPGQGTTVALWLPVAPEAALAAGPDPAPEPSPIPAQRALRVLLVDDDPLVRSGTAAMLEDLGHRVTVAASGAAALAALRAGPAPDLLLTDYAMPEMTGLALAAAARALQPGLPVILATGYAELPPGLAHELPRLDKPFRQEALAALIARVTAPPASGTAPQPQSALG